MANDVKRKMAKLEEWKRLHFWKTMRAYAGRYTHVLSAYGTENNLRKMAQKRKT